MAAQVQVQSQVQTATPAAAGLGGTPLYVGDLDLNVTDSQLHDFFSQVGELVSVRVCRDLSTGLSLGYGYVNYTKPQDAERALDQLNFTPLNGKPIRIMYSNRDPTVRRSGAGNLYIKNLDKEIDHKDLYETFSPFGKVLSCKVALDGSGQSMGFGFVQYATEESAQKAIEKLNGMLFNGKQVYVGPFVRKQERATLVDKTKFTNVFVKNLSESTTEEDLEKVFGEFGLITSSVVMRNGDGTSKCFGFVNFESAEDAARAVESLNGKKIGDKDWFVGRAQKKSEREVEMKHQLEQNVNVKDVAGKSRGLNLYVKNLDDSIGDDELNQLFSPFGLVTSCKVVRDPKGISTGSGFVAFSSPEEASKALSGLNGRMIGKKPLYVAIAQKKEDRKAQLQAQFAQMRPIAMTPALTPRVPVYTSAGSALGPQMFYGQPQPPIVPPQSGFGYQQQLVPGMRHAGPHIPNMLLPILHQGQQGPHPGGRRPNAVQMQQVTQPIQMGGRGRGYRYPPGRVFPSRDSFIAQPSPIAALSSALAVAPPADQRTLLGENLYPLVEQIEPKSAAKITGMLLEMDKTEVFGLLESPVALKAKVAEAVAVLNDVSQEANGTAEKLSSLSLNE